MRLANADVLPFEFTNLADTVNRYVVELGMLAARGEGAKSVDLEPMKSALTALSESARRYEMALQQATAADFKAVKDFKALNALLYKSERKLTNEQGLPRRPWFKHQLYAPGFYTGYGVKTIPGVREALEEKQWHEVEPQVKNVSAALRALAAQLDEATRLLDGR